MLVYNTACVVNIRIVVDSTVVVTLDSSSDDSQSPRTIALNSF